MNASDTTVILTRRSNGATTVHDAKTGRVLGELPPGALRTGPEPLDEQLRATEIRRRRERSENIAAGFVLGVAVVVGLVLGFAIAHV